jgi:hypothetical protein
MARHLVISVTPSPVFRAKLSLLPSPGRLADDAMSMMSLFELAIASLTSPPSSSGATISQVSSSAFNRCTSAIDCQPEVFACASEDPCCGVS